MDNLRIKMLKIFRSTFKYLLIVAITTIVTIFGIAYLCFKADATIGKNLHQFLSEVTGVNVKIDSVKISPLLGILEIRELTLGNPEGYKTESALKFERVRVEFDTSSIFSQKLIIDEIYLHNPEITFEGSLDGSNLSKIQKNIESFSRKNATTDPEEQKYKVKNLAIGQGNINLSMRILQGRSATLKLSKITKDLSQERKSSSLEVFKYTYTTLLDSVLDLVKNSIDLLIQTPIEAGKAIIKAPVKIGEIIIKTPARIGQGVRNMLGRGESKKNKEQEEVKK